MPEFSNAFKIAVVKWLEHTIMGRVSLENICKNISSSEARAFIKI